MPYSVDITGFSGGTPPITFYVCDQYGNNCSVLGTTTGVYVLGGTPPITFFVYKVSN